MPLLMVLLALSVSGLSFMVLEAVTRGKLATAARMAEIHEIGPAKEEDDDEYKRPFAERILIPLYHSFLDFVRKLTPASIMERYENLIIQAGKQGKTSAVKLIGQQVLMAVVLGGAAFLLLPPAMEKRSLMVILALVVALVLPYLSLSQGAKKRLTLINRGLPDMLDLLYVSVEAGLGFDMALRRTAEKMKGPLADEFLNALTEITKGRPREEALRGVVARTQSSDLSTLITSIIQAEQLGSNIANTLQIQSNVMRQKRKQRAEEAAAKLSTKMLFPIVFFIFPAILVVVLGPAILGLINSLGGVF